MAAVRRLFLYCQCLLSFVGLIRGFWFEERDTHNVTFSNQYMALGVLSLPYAEISESFMVYYDGVAQRSRVDYYNGMVKTFQRADLGSFGLSFKVAPMTTETVLNKVSCFINNGTSKAKTKIQTLLPDLTGFKNIGDDQRFGVECLKLQKVETKGLKKNTYTIWVTKDRHTPVHYDMIGYDTLLGSHYDKYYIDYRQYMAGPPPESNFYVPDNKTCGPFPGPGVETMVQMNPMAEFIHNDDDHVHVMFNAFKKEHKKVYVSSHEHEQRKHSFRHNLRFINSKNRAGLSYRLAANHLMDRSQAEMQAMRGYRFTPGDHGGLRFNLSQYKDVPASKDWRLYGAVTPVKDQGTCGSCWSFGTTGTVEGAYFLKTGKLVRLSQQELVDCSWGEGNNACDGGEDFRSYEWIKKHGLSTEDDYGPYLAQDAFCHMAKVTPVVHLKSFVNVTPDNAAALKAAIANHGPVSVAMDAAHMSLAFYSNGVFFEPKCGNKPDQLDHAVLAVGYGVMNDQAYWLVKNSWSTHWGNDGYFIISQKDNNCGIMTNPTYPVLT